MTIFFILWFGSGLIGKLIHTKIDKSEGVKEFDIYSYVFYSFMGATTLATAIGRYLYKRLRIV